MSKKKFEPKLTWDTTANAQHGAEWRMEKILDRDTWDLEGFTYDFPALSGWGSSRADATKENLAKHLKEQGSNIGRLEDFLFQEACGDQNDDQDNWECLCECLTDWMQKVWPKRKKWPFGHWKAEGSNMGWQHRSGYKTFTAEHGQQLLSAVLPDTQCTFTIRIVKPKDGGPALHITNSHHDAEGEVYIIRPRNTDAD